MLAFGKYAGRAGLIDFLRGLGQRMHYHLLSAFTVLLLSIFLVIWSSVQVSFYDIQVVWHGDNE